MNKKNSTLITAAIAGVLAAGTTLVSTSARAEVNCYGANSCKGTGACGSKTTGASCAGSNACKGQGFLKLKDEAECKAKGGSLTEATAAAKDTATAKKQEGKKAGKEKTAKGKAAAKSATEDATKAATTTTP